MTINTRARQRFSRRPSGAAAGTTAIVEVAAEAGLLAGELGEVSTNLEVVSAVVADQAVTFGRLQEASGQIRAGNAQVSATAERVLGSSRQASADVTASQGAVRDSLAAIHTLVGWVGSLAGELESTRVALGDIAAIAKQVNGIAEQTHILALNAGVEAARSGDAGKGFTVIADNVRQLADQSIRAARDIDATLSSLGDKIAALTEHGAQAQERAEAARGATGSIGGALETFGAAMVSVSDQVTGIVGTAERGAQDVEEFHGDMSALVDSVGAASRELDTARARMGALRTSSTTLCNGVASMGR